MTAPTEPVGRRSQATASARTRSLRVYEQNPSLVVVTGIILDLEDTMTEQDSHEQVREMQRIDAVARLAFARGTHPELNRAEASARVDLAAAIMAMDEAADVPGRHNMQEQAEVERAIRAYADALADLVRGEASEPAALEVTVVEATFL